MLLVVYVSISHPNKFFERTFFRKLTDLCNSFVEIDASQQNPAQFVNPCPPVFFRVGISILERVDSQLGKTKPVALKQLWSGFPDD